MWPVLGLPLAGLVGVALWKSWSLSSLGLAVLVVAGVPVAVWVLLVGSHALRRKLGTWVQVHEHGFVLGRGGATYELPWSRLESLTIVPAGSTASAARAGAIVCADGRRFALPPDLENAVSLVERIDEALEQHVLPRLSAAFDAGEDVRFGHDVGLSSHGVTYGERKVAWKDIAVVREEREVIDLLDARRKRVLEIDKHDLPNADLFVALVSRRVRAPERGYT